MEDYWIAVNRSFQDMLPALPALPKRVLDIGCGSGGIDVLLGKFYGRHLQFCLLDGSAVHEGPLYGYNTEDRFYCNLEDATELLRTNGLTNVQAINVLTDPFPEGPFDLVVSLVSYGFHYPISTYADQVRETCKGTLILEVRRGESEEQAVEAFGTPRILAKYDKRVMMSWELRLPSRLLPSYPATADRDLWTIKGKCA